jgi:hypothetical protein
VRLLRLLLALRARLWWRSVTASGRWVGVVAPFGLFVLFWPVWLAGSFGAWWAVRELGAAAHPLVAGLVQVAWVSTSVLSASVGRALSPRDLLRYPVRPGALFAFNAAAGAVEPSTLVLLVPLGALVVASFAHGGAVAGLLSLAATAFSLALTLAFLQVLLGLLEGLLRTEWMRMLSRLLLALIFLGVSWSYSELAERHLAPALAERAPLVASLRGAAALLERWPTIGAPAAIAAAAHGGGWGRAALGALASAAMLAAFALAGTRLMLRNAVAPEHAVGGGRRTTGAIEAIASLFPGRLANLVRFDLLVQARSPRGLLWVLLTPLLITAFYAAYGSTAGRAPVFAVVMSVTTLSQVSLMLWAHHGPGIRTLYLLPLPARDLVLARNVTYALEAALLAMLLGATLAALGGGLVPSQLPAWAFASLAMLGVMLASGNVLSVRWPARTSSGWSSQRGVSWQATLLGFAAAGAAGAVLAATAFVAPRVAPPGAGDAVTAAALAAEAAAAAAIWWRSVDAAARAFVSGRERMIEALARESAAS